MRNEDVTRLAAGGDTFELRRSPWAPERDFDLVNVTRSTMVGSLTLLGGGPGWILTGPWAPSPVHEPENRYHLRNQPAFVALMMGCEKEGIPLDRVQAHDDRCLMLLADARGPARLRGYDPNATIAANE